MKSTRVLIVLEEIIVKGVIVKELELIFIVVKENYVKDGHECWKK